MNHLKSADWHLQKLRSEMLDMTKLKTKLNKCKILCDDNLSNLECKMNDCIEEGYKLSHFEDSHMQGDYIAIMVKGKKSKYTTEQVNYLMKCSITWAIGLQHYPTNEEVNEAVNDIKKG